MDDNLYSQMALLGFSLRNSSFNFKGNGCIYSVGEGEEKIPKSSY